MLDLLGAVADANEVGMFADIEVHDSIVIYFANHGGTAQVRKNGNMTMTMSNC